MSKVIGYLIKDGVSIPLYSNDGSEKKLDFLINHLVDKLCPPYKNSLDKDCCREDFGYVPPDDNYDCKKCWEKWVELNTNKELR